MTYCKPRYEHPFIGNTYEIVANLAENEESYQEASKLYFLAAKECWLSGDRAGGNALEKKSKEMFYKYSITKGLI